MSNFFGERNLCFRSFEQIRSVQTRSEPRRLIVDRVRKGLVSQLCGKSKSQLRWVFLKQAGQYRSHQTEGFFFEQTNVEDEYLCVYDFEQAQTGLEVCWRETTLEAYFKALKQAGVTEHWTRTLELASEGDPGATLAETARNFFFKMLDCNRCYLFTRVRAKWRWPGGSRVAREPIVRDAPNWSHPGRDRSVTEGDWR
jgi:hypothetical protein